MDNGVFLGSHKAELLKKIIILDKVAFKIRVFKKGRDWTARHIKENISNLLKRHLRNYLVWLSSPTFSSTCNKKEQLEVTLQQLGP